MRVDPIGLLFMALTISLVVIAAVIPAIQQRRKGDQSE